MILFPSHRKATAMAKQQEANKEWGKGNPNPNANPNFNTDANVANEQQNKAASTDPNTGIVQSENYGQQATPGKPKTEEGLHTQVVDNDILRHSGKETGLVHAPIKSIAPSSGVGPKSPAEDAVIIKDVSALIGDDRDDEYPFEKLEMGQAFFIPTQPNSTTDALLAKMHQRADTAKQHYGQIEVDKDGNEIWEMLCVMTKKRNDDGTIQLENNKPITGADFTQRPKYIYARNFIVKSVIKDQELGKGEKSKADGVVVIRVA